MSKSELLRFKVTNFKSIKRTQEIFFAKGSSNPSVVAFYGPNAGGKSNIVTALQFVQFFIRHSAEASLTKIPVEPFLLNTLSRKLPSEFEIELIQNQRRLVYGFAVTKDIVTREYLEEYTGKMRATKRTIFTRDSHGVNAAASRYKFGKKLFVSTRPNTLLVTKNRENNNEFSNLIFEWLNNVNFLNNLDRETMGYTVKQIQSSPEMTQSVLDLMAEADLFIRSILIQNEKVPESILKNFPLNEEARKSIADKTRFSIQTVHAVRDQDQKLVGEQIFDLDRNESSGTRKFFELSAPIIDTLNKGKILYLDEFGVYLHPDMCKYIVSLFQSERNKHGAKLIINSHDTSIMNLLSREEIIFVEKNHLEETIISPLSSKSERLNGAFEKRYRDGLYGAKPMIEG